MVVEKILAAGEELPASWPVDGTTGYDALREVCGVFVDPAGEAVLTELAADSRTSRRRGGPQPAADHRRARWSPRCAGSPRCVPGTPAGRRWPS